MHNKSKSKKSIVFPILAFIIPLVFSMVVFAIEKVAPFGDNTVASVDFNNQYLALFAYLKRLLSGQESAIYSLQLGLGGSFFGVLTYYLISPFNLLLVFFSMHSLPLFGTVISLLKIAFVGFTTFEYLTHSQFLRSEFFPKVNARQIKMTALIFSSSFALMGYIFAYKECIMWLDAIILLPIVLLGIDQIVYKNRISLFVISLTFAIFTNFYFGYIIALFSGVLFITWMVRSALMGYRGVFTKFGRFVIAGLLSVMLSAVIIIPSYLSTEGISKNTKFAFKAVYASSNFISQFFNDVQAANMQFNNPIVFVGLVALSLMILFFISRGLTFVDKILGACVLLFLFLSSWLDFFYLIWHAMSWPNGYPQREAFIIPFVVIVLGFVAVLNAMQHKNVEIKPFVAVYVFIAFLAMIAANNISGKYLLAAMVIIAVALACTWMFIRTPGLIWGTGLLMIALVSLFLVDLKIESISANKSLKLSSYQKFYKQTDSVVTKISNRNEASRIGNRYQASDNDPLLFGFNGVSNYVSQQPTSVTDYLSSVGYYQKHVWKRWSNYNDGSTLSFDRLLGIKYTYGNNSASYNNLMYRVNSSMSADNEAKFFPEDRGLTVHHDGASVITSDRYALPLVFRAADGNIHPLHLPRYDTMNNPFDVQNSVWRSVTGDKGLLTDQSVTKSADAGEFTIHVNDSGNLYLYLPTNRNLQFPETYLFVNGKLVTNLFSRDGENGIVYLGKYKRSDLVVVSFRSAPSAVASASRVDNLPVVASENEKAFHTAYIKMVNGTVKNIKINGPKIMFDTTSKFNQSDVLLTIPFDKNWQVEIDGHNSEKSLGAGSFVKIGIPSGKHRVVLKYHVAGLKLGMIISVMGILSVVVYSAIVVGNKRHRN